MLGSTNRSEAEVFVELAGDPVAAADLEPYPPRVLFLRSLNGPLHQGSPNPVPAPVGVNDDIADHSTAMAARLGVTQGEVAYDLSILHPYESNRVKTSAVDRTAECVGPGNLAHLTQHLPAPWIQFGPKSDFDKVQHSRHIASRIDRPDVRMCVRYDIGPPDVSIARLTGLLLAAAAPVTKYRVSR